MNEPERTRLPTWLRVPLPAGPRYDALKTSLRGLGLHTVCEEARCPNVGECWAEGTATLMLLGDTCTRGCRFCAVKKGKPQGIVDRDEPKKVAEAVARMRLAYVVLTMVDRDDLPDGGAAHVAETVRRIREACPGIVVETLVGDFAGADRDVATVVKEGRPEVFAHNVEVVPELQSTMRDRRCSWDRSIEVLLSARCAGAPVIKTSLMVGCGETRSQVEAAIERIAAAGVDVLTIGQYLRPSEKHAPVDRFVHPDEFAAYAEIGRAAGLRYVASGPLVRSSYRAAEAFLRAEVGARKPAFEDPYGKRLRLPVMH